MHREIERLIDLALADGKITDKELEVLYRKANQLGADMDEFEMVLEGKLRASQRDAPPITANRISSQKEGSVRKCPTCGEPVPALLLQCRSCGHEFRNIVANQSIQSLFTEIKMIADTIDHSKVENWDVDGKLYHLILNWPIPNTKEDLIEFYARGIASIREDALTGDGVNSSTAWLAKCKEVVAKLEVIALGDPSIVPIVDRFRSETMNKEKQMKATETKWWIIGVLIAVVGWGLIFLFGGKK